MPHAIVERKRKDGQRTVGTPESWIEAVRLPKKPQWLDTMDVVITLNDDPIILDEWIRNRVRITNSDQQQTQCEYLRLRHRRGILSKRHSRAGNVRCLHSALDRPVSPVFHYSE